jgi:hypothetical protein
VPREREREMKERKKVAGERDRRERERKENNKKVLKLIFKEIEGVIENVCWSVYREMSS